MAKGARPGLFRSIEAPIRNLVNAVKQDQAQMLRAKGDPEKADREERKAGRKLDLKLYSDGLKLVPLSEHEEVKKTSAVWRTRTGVVYRGNA
jgi:hypothetical protein